MPSSRLWVFDLDNTLHHASAGVFPLINQQMTDYIAQLFGNIPVVHHVGGLVKVVDGETGIAYRKEEAVFLLEALERAMALYARPDALRRMQWQAVQRIRQKHTWGTVMKKYLKLYEKARMLRWVESSGMKRM